MVNKVAIIIPDKYDKASFQGIILVHWYPKANDSVFETISSTTAAYMSLYYILFFLYRDLCWYWVLTLYDPKNI